MAYRDSASFGKRWEYIVVGELLRRGFDVYMTLVDDQGIDCIIRLDQDRFLDVQIKARSKKARQWNSFGPLDFEVRDNYFFILYLEKTDTTWIMPSEDVRCLSNWNAGGKNIGKGTINLPKSPDSKTWRKFEKYLGDNGFQLLWDFGA